MVAMTSTIGTLHVALTVTVTVAKGPHELVAFRF
jgi:hypothetical protein